MDPELEAACRLASIPPTGKLNKKQLQTVAPYLQRLHAEQTGKNIHTFYAHSPGSSHTKMMMLVYPNFLRLVITSCNMMDFDTELGDNHWYIHDLPELSSRATAPACEFEADILAHMHSLDVPDSFIRMITAKYDYSSVKVALITSVYGPHRGDYAEKYGLLRLRRKILDTISALPFQGECSPNLLLEVCTASIGQLQLQWLDEFRHCILGGDPNSEDPPQAALKIIYPTTKNVKDADPTAQDGAGSIGCHIPGWKDQSEKLKRYFHQYKSKDKGRLFHQKLLTLYNPMDAQQLPRFIYVGSANFSQSAWGALANDIDNSKAPHGRKLIKITNLECGVLIPGHILMQLLEPETTDWRDIVPYDQNSSCYTIIDKPWSDVRWVKGFKPSWKR